MTDAAEPIVDALARLAREAPDRPAITVDAVSITRGELDRYTNRLARAFEDEGVGRDDLVTIALPNSIDFIASMIACWKLGSIPQPVSWRLPARELETIVELADAKLVVGIDESRVPGRRAWPPGRVPGSTYDDGLLPTVVSSSWKAPTSGGSTGRPKLILSGDRAVISSEPPRGLQRNGCVFIPGPLYHNAPLTFASYGLFHGNHVVLLSHFDAESALQAIDRHRPDWALLVPTMMIRVLRLDEATRGRYDVSSLRTVWHMGAPCPPWVKEAWIDWLGAEVIWELYAGTEAQAIAVIRGDEWLGHRGSVGRVISGEMKVVDPDTLVELPRGSVGEVFLRRSPGEPSSYRYVGAEAYAIGDGWESLGDMGWFDEEDFLYLADRRADMILSGGANIYPAEVEGALNEHHAVQSCAVIGLPDDELGQRVHAVLYAPTGVTLPDDEELQSFVAERLVRYKVPRSFEWVNEPVRDDAGKVRRGALRDDRLRR